MRILLLCSAFNGLTQRVWIELRSAGHDVSVELASSEEAMRRAVMRIDPDLVLCPFLRERVPAEVWMHRRTIIIHPGPKGDRGPSALDWAISDGASSWGVTAVQAVEEMDAGPIWGSWTFAIPTDPPRKSTLYNGPIADAALELVREVVDRAGDPSFTPEPLDYRRPDVTGRLRPAMRQCEREFAWEDTTAHIVRRIRAADGSPGVRTDLCGIAVSVFAAHPGAASPGAPGTIAGRRHGAVLVRTGDGGVWIGQVRMVTEPGTTSIKLPATMALGRRLAGVAESFMPLTPAAEQMGPREITYRRDGSVGIVRFDFYNGAMSTGQCRRLAAALRYAAAQDTRVLVIRGGEVFSNGIHLNVIEAAPHPPIEAWRNINAIDELCAEIIRCTNQIVVASVSGNAGAGGVMLGLGADHVLLRDGVVLNPHYGTIGLYGSEYWTYVLPRRVGDGCARSLIDQHLPIGARQAATIGLADRVFAGSPSEFERTVLDHAAQLAASDDYVQQLDDKRTARREDERSRPLEAYRVRELAEMSGDIFDDRQGFAAARHAFVTKRRPSSLAGYLSRPAAGRPESHAVWPPAHALDA